MTGTIKTVTDKNFGFIAQGGGQPDVFFHATSLNGVDFSELKAGDAVNFETEETEKGPRAINVTLA